MSIFRPGKELKITEHPTFNSERSDLSELVKLPPDQLKELEAGSISEEQSIYDELCAVVNKWLGQAKKTIDYQKAQEYLKVRPVEHTSNHWTFDQYDRHEMSNMVYRFSWRVNERTEYDHTIKKSVPVAWALSWSVNFNTTHCADQYGSQIAGQNKKVFKDRAVMEKYLEGRIAAYAHLFTEISPPVPEDAREQFCVNGVLLPGYTIETPEPVRSDEQSIDNLLDLLDDDDMDLLPQPEEPVPVPAEPPQKFSPQKHRPHKHRDAGPVR